MADAAPQSPYISDTIQQVLTLIEALAGHEIEGLSPSQIAQASGLSPSQVTRYMANLRHKGWAEEIPATGRLRLGPTPVRLAVRHSAAIGRAQAQLDGIRSRFGTEAA